MYKNVLIASVASLGMLLPALASDREDDIGRVEKAGRVFHEIMATPDKAIPRDLMEKAKCIVIIPGEEKAAFIFGGNYGKGVAPAGLPPAGALRCLSRSEAGASASRLAASFTDSVMLFMNDHALHSLLGDKFKVGGDVTVAAGPVGRQASANTDVRLDAEILSYSRSKGLFRRDQSGWRGGAGRPQRRPGHVRPRGHPRGNSRR